MKQAIKKQIESKWQYAKQDTFDMQWQWEITFVDDI